MAAPAEEISLREIFRDRTGSYLYVEKVVNDTRTLENSNFGRNVPLQVGDCF